MKLKSLLIITASSLLLASCLKSKDSLGVHGDKGSIVSEIWDINYYGDPKVIALNATPAQETVSDFLTLRTYAARSNQPPGGKVHIKLALDDAAVTAAGLTVLPANAYTLGGLEFDVPANGEVKIPFTLDKTKLDLSQSYGLGFKITDVSSGVASDIAKSLIVNILVKNKYDGHYSVNGTMVDAANAALTGNYPMDVNLITSGANSVYMYDNDIGGPAHSILSNGGLSYYGSFAPEFYFDASDNITQVLNTYGQPSGNGRSAQLDPSGTNKWNSADKSIDVKYWMNQPSVISPHRTSFDEHFTYLGPR